MTMFILPRMVESEFGSAAQNTGETSGFGALRTSAGNLPLKQLHYQTRIVGLAIHTTIAQTYYNPFDERIEATYIFPIEGEQAVTDCQMWIGTRAVRAALKERGQARTDYQRAIARGHRAALLEENRPETFSMKVGNIAPGEAVQVRIETVGHLPVVEGEWTLRIPLVVAPRYTSGIALPGVLIGGSSGNSAGDGVAWDTDQVPDASAVTPPTWLPGFPSPVDLKLEVTVSPGSLVTDADWRTRMRSSLHAVTTEQQGEGASQTCVVRVQPGERINRDFILRGSYGQSSIAAAVVVEPLTRSTETVGGDSRSTIAIQLVPPNVDARVPRDIVFVLDRSGSMSGWKMDASRRGISRLIDALLPQDRFRVIAFDDKFDSPAFSDGSRWAEATDENRYEAVRWLAKLDARGGTEMGKAIKQALYDFAALPTAIHASTSRARAIVLVTDGQITGEDAVIRTLGTVPDSLRPQIFCLGVDRAVNGSVLQRLTKLTGGTYELAESHNRLDEAMKRLASEIGSPALSEVQIIAENSEEDFQWAPSRAKTLYAGRALSIYGRINGDVPLTVTVRGRLASGEPWQQTLSVPASGRVVPEAVSPPLTPTLLPMWARGRIRELEDTLISMPMRDVAIKNEIIACSLGSRVLSRFTAFVAIDETEQTHLDGELHKVLQPVEAPDGWKAMPLATIDPQHLVPLHGRKPKSESVKPTIDNAARSGLSSLPPNFESLILGRGIVSREQWNDAAEFAKQSSQSMSDALLGMQYATPEHIAKVTADAYRLPYIDLKSTPIDDEVIELVPESVARENKIIQVAESGRSLTIAMSDPADLDTIEKLRFILNREIQTVVASHSAILGAINKYYGEVEGESADSMLQEFTDTAIDFTETTADANLLDDGLDDDTDDDMAFGTCMLSSPAAPGEYLADVGPVPWFALETMTTRQHGPIARLLDPFLKLIAKPAASPTPPPARAVRLVQLMMGEAISLRASHVILRPAGDALEAVYVIDGKEVPRDRVPSDLVKGIVTRLKVLCHLDVTATKPLESGRCPLSLNSERTTCEVHFRETIAGTSILVDFVSLPSDQAPDAVKAWWA